MEAEDYTQRVFERLLRYAGVREPTALMRVVARGLLNDAYRQAAARPRDLSWEELIGETGDGLDHLPQFQTYDEYAFAEDFDSAVRALDDEPRDAFILGELRGLTSREAGAVLGVSRTTAANRRLDATGAIKEAMLHPEA